MKKDPVFGPSAIYGLPINLRYIHKRFPGLLYIQKAGGPQKHKSQDLIWAPRTLGSSSHRLHRS